ncbi:CRISPR system precrRNA processing endoribonuclease RAMP protein Cas6 [Ruegeria sp.]|uniref:CRISPR system precrRNA processing endoribonuclease RAMP protein Cas6 n=1 Tax=Ruegeria sp. TaxID=1879320 RepID=UPI003C7BA316
MDESKIEKEIFALTGGLSICAFRILLDTGSVRATVPMLRGVWGCALRDLDLSAYEIMFEGYRPNMTPNFGRLNLPLYVMRPAPPNPDFAPAIELLLLGKACRYDNVALEAFELATKAGLGKWREPFRVRKVCGVLPDGRQVREPQTWPASDAVSCLLRDVSNSDGLRLDFDAPLRILRRGKLVNVPSFVDMAVAGLRRLYAVSSVSFNMRLSARALEAARRLPVSNWYGQQQDLVRWSGRQKNRVEMRGVTGWLDLPEGAGPFRPLLAACEWTHLGKGTVFGLGNLKLRSLQTQ